MNVWNIRDVKFNNKPSLLPTPFHKPTASPQYTSTPEFMLDGPDFLSSMA